MKEQRPPRTTEENLRMELSQTGHRLTALLLNPIPKNVYWRLSVEEALKRLQCVLDLCPRPTEWE